jgi:hypothetical protein
MFGFPSMSLEDSATDGWFCRVFGTEFGPLPVEMVRRMIETEQLGSDDAVRCGKTGPWQMVQQITEFRALLKALNQLAKPTSPEYLPKIVEPKDDWYYRLDGREHGPFALDALQQLIGTSGDTVSDVLIRQGNDGTWGPYYSLPGMSPLPESVTAFSPNRSPHPRSSITSPRAGQTSAEGLRELLRGNWRLVIVATAWVLANAVLIVGLPQPYATERGYYDTLRGLEAEANDLQARNASQQEWTDFRARVKDTLTPIIQDLKKRASATEPVCQHLLWAARDQFPKLTGPRTAATKEPQSLYERHMRLVDVELARQ